MPKAKVTSKGQITVPKKVREKMNIYPGDELPLEKMIKEKQLLKQIKNRLNAWLEYYIARLKRRSQLKR